MADLPLAVHARGVAKRYGDAVALDGVDLAVRPGTVHGLLGTNGAGKTTLLRVLLGLVPPDAGEVRVLGAQVVAGAGAPDGLGGFVETPAAWPWLTGRRTLHLLARLDRAVAVDPDEALAAVGLADRADDRVGGYSLGMRQRLGLAAALVRAGRLLVVDEPGNGLDPAAARDLRALLARLAERGTAVLLSSHDMAEVEQLCGTVTVLRAGRVAFSGSLAALRAHAPAPVSVLRTSDDALARAVAAGVRGLRLETGAELRLHGGTPAVDALVHALSDAGVAVRALQAEQRPLADVVLAVAGAAPLPAEPAPRRPVRAGR